MADFTGQEDPYLAFINAGLDPYMPDAPDPLALTEYGLPGGIVQLPPPPPPPPPVKTIGGNPAIEETAGPIPAAVPVPPDGAAAAQPGSLFGIPASVVDGVAFPPEPAAAPDPWAGIQPAAESDPWDLQPNAPAASHSFDEVVRPLDEVGRGVWLDTADEEQVADALSQNPVALAKYRGAKIGEMQAEAANRRTAALVEDTKLHEANLKARAEAKAKADQLAAQVDQEAKSLSADGGFWASRTFGQELAGVLAVVLGGLHSSAKGGKNIGVDAINLAIDRHIAAQRSKLADRRSSVGAMYERLGNDFATSEAIRAAGWKLTEQKLLSDAQQYDPRSSRVMLIAGEVANARAQQAQAIAKVREAEEKRLNQQIELDLKRQAEARQARAQVETERHNRDTTKTANWNASINAGELAFKKEDAKAKNQLERDKLIAKRDEDLTKLDRENAIGGVIGPDGTLLNLTQADGKTTFHASPEEHKAIVKSRNGALNLLDTMSKLKSLRDKAGGANKFTSPSDQLEYERLANRAIIDYANATGASFSDEQSKNLVRDRLFGGDPSGYNVGDAIGRIDRSMDEVKRGYVNQLRTAKWTGDAKDALQFIDSYKLEDAPLTADEQDFKDLFIHPSEAKGEERARLGLGGATGEGGPSIAPAQQHTLEALRQQALRDPNAPDEKGEKPSAALIAQRTKERDTALERLRRVADEAPRQQSHGGPFGLVPEGGESGIGVEARKILDSLIAPALDLNDPRATQKGAKDTLDPRAVR